MKFKRHMLALHVFFALAALSACHSEVSAGGDPEFMGIAAATSEILASNNWQLIAAAVNYLQEADKAREVLSLLEASDLGRARLQGASRVLGQQMQSVPTLEGYSALSLLAPDAANAARFFSDFPHLAHESNFSADEQPVNIYEVAARFDSTAARWQRMLREANDLEVGEVLNVLRVHRIRLDWNILQPYIDNELKLLAQETPTNAVQLRRGRVLLLTDDIGQHYEWRSVSGLDARAIALLIDNEPAASARFLSISLATGKSLKDSDLDDWLLTVRGLEGSVPSSTLADLVDEVVVGDEGRTRLRTLLRLPGRLLFGEAQGEIQRQSEPIPISPNRNHSRAGRSIQAVESACTSAFGRKSVLPLADTSVDALATLVSAFRNVSAPQAEVEQIARRVVGGDAGMKESRCIVGLHLSGLLGRDSLHIQSLDTIDSSLNKRGFPQFSQSEVNECRAIEQEYARLGTQYLQSLNIESAVFYINRCYDTADEIASLRIFMGQMRSQLSAYTAFRSFSAEELVSSRRSPDLLCFLVPDMAWSRSGFDFTRVPASGQMLDGLLHKPSKILDGQIKAECLNYYNLLNPAIVGSTVPGNITEAATTSFARAALAGRSPAVAHWLVMKLGNYEKVAQQSAFDDVLNTMALVLRGIDGAVARTNSGHFAGGDAKLTRTARLGVLSEVMTAWNHLCQRNATPFSSLLARVARTSSCVTGQGARSAREILAVAASLGESGKLHALDAQLQPKPWSIPALVGGFIGLHTAGWAILFITYPYSRIVQVTVFWNPSVRKYAGLIYIQLLLLTVPCLRRRIMQPFKDVLTSEGRRSSLDREVYFRDLYASLETSGTPKNGKLMEILPALHGQVWIEAQSGAGKTWFLRELARSEREPLVFLNATSCRDGGIIKAISRLFAGWLADEEFLESIIYAGGLIVVIDGLNEVDPELRAQIVSFADAHPGARVAIATQPVKTIPPRRASVLRIESVRSEQIRKFLSQQASEVVSTDAAAVAYRSKIDSFAAAMDEKSDRREGDALRALISNPMDLRTVATLLAAGIEPDLLSLQKQQILLACDQYAREFQEAFPMQEFCTTLYTLRIENRALTIAHNEFEKEREVLREQKLLQRQDTADGGFRWRFRHDKITDYFLFWHFKESSRDGCDLFLKHLEDNRFIGVYVLLARLLPTADADNLLNKLAYEAPPIEDWTVGSVFLESLQQRMRLQEFNLNTPGPRTQ
jgi:hypothetical protein